MARHLLPRLQRQERRTLDAAAVEGMRAAGMEMAAGRRVHRRRNLALDGSEAPAPPVDARDLVEQRRSVGMTRMLEHRICRRHLDHPAQVHDDDPVGDVAHHAEIVADEQQRQAEIPPQVHEQVDDLRLDRHVEGRDALVADQEIGVHGQRAGDADALPLSAGELVRIAVGHCGVEADGREHPRNQRRDFGSRHQPVDARCLPHDCRHAQTGIER